MTEAKIRKEAIKELEAGGYVYWFPPRVKFYQNDIFGVFDFVAIDKFSNLIFVQITSASNMSARFKKVDEFLTRHQIVLNAQIWGWSYLTGTFNKESV